MYDARSGRRFWLDDQVFVQVRGRKLHWNRREKTNQHDDVTVQLCLYIKSFFFFYAESHLAATPMVQCMGSADIQALSGYDYLVPLRIVSPVHVHQGVSALPCQAEGSPAAATEYEEKDCSSVIYAVQTSHLISLFNSYTK